MKSLEWWMKKLEKSGGHAERFLSTAINDGWLTDGHMLVQLSEEQQKAFRKRFRTKAVREARRMAYQEILPQKGSTLGKMLTVIAEHPALPSPRYPSETLLPFLVLQHPDGSKGYIPAMEAKTLEAWHPNCQWHATWDTRYNPNWSMCPVFYAGRKTVGAIMTLDPQLYGKVKP